MPNVFEVLKGLLIKLFTKNADAYCSQFFFVQYYAFFRFSFFSIFLFLLKLPNRKQSFTKQSITLFSHDNVRPNKISISAFLTFLLSFRVSDSSSRRVWPSPGPNTAKISSEKLQILKGSKISRSRSYWLPFVAPSTLLPRRQTLQFFNDLNYDIQFF